MSRTAEILVAHSYYLRHDAKQVEKMKPYPPLATLLCAAVARERGHRVAFFDAMLAPGVEAFEAMLDEVQPRVVGVLEDNFNFLTKMCTLRNREASLAMVRLAKSRGCRVAVNGSDAADRPWLYLAAGADAVIVGEAEGGFLELAERWLGEPDARVDDVAGLLLAPAEPGWAAAVAGTGPAALAGSGAAGQLARTRVRYTPARPAVEELDGLPFPAWDLVDAEAYRRAWTGAHGRLSWNMVTSRGCPYGCNWCAKPLFGRRYVQRSPASVAEELRRLKDDVAPDHVWFADDIFGLTAGWIHDFATEVTARRARTPFLMQSRVNLMKPATVAALVEAGAEEVWLGVESGSQKILDAMDKGTRVEQVRSATRALKEHGVRVGWFLQLGYLGEEWEDVVRTRELVRDERPDDVGVSVAYPLPGTKFHDMVRAQLGAKQNWTESDELAMLFHGTYVTPFYKRIRDALHDEVRPGASAGELEARWARLAAEEAEQRTTPAAGAVG